MQTPRKPLKMQTLMTKNILYIGRFQPFHNGHADAVQQILEKYPEISDTNDCAHLFIGIGSAENNFEEKNPLTAGERFEIIDAAMQEMNISRNHYSIIPIRNINHYALWPHHVQQYLPEISVLASGSKLVQNLWKTSFPHSEIIEIAQNKKISGTIIRQKISEISGNKKTDEIHTYVLSSVLKKIQKFRLQERLLKMKTEF